MRVCKANILLQFPGVRQIRRVKKFSVAAAGGRDRKVKGRGDNFKRKYFMPNIDSRFQSI